MKTVKNILVIGGLLLVLSGCSGGNGPEEKMYEILEKVVSVEKEFANQQDPLVELEKQEKEIYDKLISLNMDDYEQIVSLADEALGIVDEREKHLNSENESIKKSKEEFQKVQDIVGDIKDSALKEEAEQLISLMNTRYDSYDKLYENYSNAIELDRTLYEMFKDKELTLEQLEEQINKINDMYEQVISANNKFNEVTDQYNKAKVTFYKNAGLNVVNSENE